MEFVTLAAAELVECAETVFADGLPMLERDLCDLLPRLAVGIAGRGSECFGFDDEISQDHDFCTGFSIWISEADDRTHGFKLTRAYNELYKNFLFG